MTWVADATVLAAVYVAVAALVVWCLPGDWGWSKSPRVAAAQVAARLIAAAVLGIIGAVYGGRINLHLYSRTVPMGLLIWLIVSTIAGHITDGLNGEQPKA